MAFKISLILKPFIFISSHYKVVRSTEKWNALKVNTCFVLVHIYSKVSNVWFRELATLLTSYKVEFT